MVRVGGSASRIIGDRGVTDPGGGKRTRGGGGGAHWLGSAVRNWHAPDKVKGVRQFVGFVGYYRRFVKDFADLAEPLVALTRKGAPSSAQGLPHLCPYPGFSNRRGQISVRHGHKPLRSWGGGGLNQVQDGREVVISYASCSLRLYTSGVTVPHAVRYWPRS